MKRIMIIGNAGAGKSTLARSLSEKLKLPLYHLDTIYWLPGWQKRDRAEWLDIHEKLTMGDEWIIDGNYRGTQFERAERADTIIYLNFSTLTCLAGVMKRRLSKEKRADIAEGCPEKIDATFLSWIITYKYNTAPAVRKLISGLPLDKKVIELKNRRDVERFLEHIK